MVGLCFVWYFMKGDWCMRKSFIVILKGLLLGVGMLVIILVFFVILSVWGSCCEDESNDYYKQQCEVVFDVEWE